MNVLQSLLTNVFQSWMTSTAGAVPLVTGISNIITNHTVASQDIVNIATGVIGLLAPDGTKVAPKS